MENEGRNLDICVTDQVDAPILAILIAVKGKEKH
jgi:hypothetical protein